MKLSKSDVKLFYELMWALQFHVNLKFKIYSQIKNIEDYADCKIDQKVKIRKTLYENIEFIDSFVLENPQNFSREKLFIVSKWKNYIGGDFYIERLLKKYAVFMQDGEVYGVLGLSQGFDEQIHPSTLPQSVSTVLLPFKGKIIYDGLLGHRNIQFGGGIKSSLRETYMWAKQNDRILDSLEISQDGDQNEITGKPLKDWKPELDEIAGKVKKLKGAAGHPAIYSPAFSLAKASIEFTQLAVADDNDWEGLNKALQKIRRALNKVHTVLDREEY